MRTVNKTQKGISDFITSYVNGDGLKTDKSFSEDLQCFNEKDRISIIQNFLSYFPNLHNQMENKFVMPAIVKEIEEREREKIKNNKKTVGT